MSRMGNEEKRIVSYLCGVRITPKMAGRWDLDERAGVISPCLFFLPASAWK